MPSYQTRHTEFDIVSGTAEPNSEMALAVLPNGIFAPEARKGQLYIVVEPDQATERGRDACQLVMRTIRKTFYEDASLSVTSALRKAIIAANRVLYQQNFSAAESKRVLIGVSCAVIKEGDLYIAQVVPSQVFVRSEGRLRAIPASTAWEPASSTPAQLIRMRAIGATLTIEPEFYRAVLRVGDGVLLCSSNLTPHLHREIVQQTLFASDSQAALAKLSEYCHQQALNEGHGLLIGLAPLLSPLAQAAPLSTAGILGRIQLAGRWLSKQVAHATGEVALFFRGRLEREQQTRVATRVERGEAEDRRLTAQPTEVYSSTNPPPMPRQIDLGEPIGDQLGRSREERSLRVRRTLRSAIPERSLPPSAVLGEPDYGIGSATERRIDLGDPQPRTARSASQAPVVAAFDQRPSGAIARVNSYFSRASRNRRMRAAPLRAGATARQTPGLSYRRERIPFPWARLLVLVSLVALLLLYGITLSNQNQVQEVDTRLTTAEQAVANIFQAADQEQARERLHVAAEAIAVVRASGTITNTLDGRQRFDSLEREYAQAENSILRISYFDSIVEVARNPQAGSPFASVIVPPLPQGITDTTGFASIYMLDANAGVLYRQPKTGGTVQAILRPQDRYGPLSVGRILSIAWRFDSIVAVAQSSEGGPYNYYFRSGDSWNFSILAGSEVWGRPTERFRIANYEGNLYLWGADPTNILRYRSGAYGEFPEPWIEEPGNKKYDSSLDLAVDGKIYLLQVDGRILVYGTNDELQRVFEREIIPQGIEPPLVATRFVVTGDPESGFIYLVDNNYSRIIQIDKLTGAFIQQIKAQPDSAIRLDGLVAMAIDTGVGRPVLYMIVDSGARVVRAALPDVPRPFRNDQGSANATPTLAATSTAVP